MKSGIHHPDKSREFYFTEGCHILESWNDPSDPTVSIARARVAPGMTTRWHALSGVTERYLIISGEGRPEVGYETAETVTQGDVVVIPPGVRQRITNTGNTDLVFYAICTPRFTSDCYMDF
jgi:mannose-6-phosphate isomerase-like protein (cupin superfamily)